MSRLHEPKSNITTHTMNTSSSLYLIIPARTVLEESCNACILIMMRFHPYLMQNGTPDDLPVPYAARSVPVSKRHKELVCGNNFRDQRHLCMFSRASRASVREQVDAPPVRDGEPRSSIAPSLMTAGACVQISSAPARLHL